LPFTAEGEKGQTMGIMEAVRRDWRQAVEKAEAKTAAKDAERDRERFLASPAGKAWTAWQRGDRFFQLDVELSEVYRTFLSVPRTAFGVSQWKGKPPTDLLG